MILGTEARVRPIVELVERLTGIGPPESRAWTSLGQRDRVHFPSDEDDYDVASESM